MASEDADTTSDTLVEQGNQHAMLQNALETAATLTRALGDLDEATCAAQTVPRNRLDEARQLVHDVVMEFADTLEDWEASGSFKSTSGVYADQTRKARLRPTYCKSLLSAYTLREDATHLRGVAKRAQESKLTSQDFRALYALTSSMLDGVRSELDEPPTLVR